MVKKLKRSRRWSVIDGRHSGAGAPSGTFWALSASENPVHVTRGPGESEHDRRMIAIGLLFAGASGAGTSLAPMACFFRSISMIRERVKTGTFMDSSLLNDLLNRNLHPLDLDGTNPRLDHPRWATVPDNSVGSAAAPQS
jgi:hypothetical protein